MLTRYLLGLSIFLIFFIGCDIVSPSSENSNVEITWLDETTTVYSLEGGQISYILGIPFEVVNGNGSINLKLDVTKGAGFLKTISKDVQKDNIYTLSLNVISNGQINCELGDVIYKIEISSAAIETPNTISFSCGGNSGIDNITIGELQILDGLHILSGMGGLAYSN